MKSVDAIIETLAYTGFALIAVGLIQIDQPGAPRSIRTRMNVGSTSHGFEVN